MIFPKEGIHLQRKIDSIQEAKSEALARPQSNSRTTMNDISSARLRLADDHESESYNNGHQKSHKIQSTTTIIIRATKLPHEIYRKERTFFPTKSQIEPLESISSN
ncbi:hypothetical protein Csa_016421 [Cucumis sativus]|uniref:Uncharacterized protein n=1 Tax=Cucumis sativus TaxID=3659 RepID=A0A0A0K5W1_CUCSA|nr:hypothetical protein Csa_016421 [Cucumis sativus]